MKKLVDAPCESNITSVEHVEELFDGQWSCGVAIALPSINKIVSTNHWANEIYSRNSFTRYLSSITL